MHRLVKNGLLDEKKESSCFYGTFPESVLDGGTLLSFRRLFAALYIYSFYLHLLLAHRDLSLELARLATLIILATASCVDNVRIAAPI